MKTFLRRLKQGHTWPFFKKIAWSVLEKVEASLIRDKGPPKYPPIFVTGLPRSGSTLLYQTICRGLKVSYFSNFMNRLPGCPVLAFILEKPFGGGHPPEKYQSWYGISPGWNAPSQALMVWMRWFGSDIPYDMYMDADFLSEIAMSEMADTIASIEAMYDSPFVNKWQGHAVHILPLVKAFPKSLFIRISRNYLQIAQSLLHSRWLLRDDPNAWTSAKPKEYEKIKEKPYIDKICEQIYYLEKNMNEDSKTVGEDRFLKLEYETLCQDPSGVVQTIREFYKQKSGGFELAPRLSIPKSFTPSTAKKVSEEDYQALKAYLYRLFGP